MAQPYIDNSDIKSYKTKFPSTDNQFNRKKSDKKLDLASMRAKDSEPVRGIFMFHECPGASMSFVYFAYKGDDIEQYTLQDGDIYTIPLGVARHLNQNGKYPIHQYQTDENGRPVARVSQFVRRFGFRSLEFTDLDDLTPIGSPSIITVERI